MNHLKENIMNHHQWSHRLRGHINLKMCMGLGAIALAGAFIVNLPAQSKPTPGKLTQPKAGCLTCGVKQPGKIEDLKLFVPQQSRLIGKISGPFRDVVTKSVISKTIEINSTSSLAHLPLQPLDNALYRIDLTASSKKEGVYGILIGNDKDESLRTTARFSEKSHLIRITGDIKGSVLGKSNLQWEFFSKPQIKRPSLAKTESEKSGVKVAGTFKGNYISLKEEGQPSVNRTIDMNEQNDLVVLNGDYFCNVVYHNQGRKDVYGASIANPKTQDTVLGAFTDVVQQQVQIQGLVQGSRFPNTIMAWGIVDFPVKMEKMRVGFNSSDSSCASCGVDTNEDNSSERSEETQSSRGVDMEVAALPALASSRIETKANAQVAPPPSTPAPTPPPTPAPTPPPGGGGNSVIGFFTKILDYIKGQERRGTCPSSLKEVAMTTDEKTAHPMTTSYKSSSPTGDCDNETTARAYVEDGLNLDIQGGPANAVLACGERAEQTYQSDKEVTTSVAKGVTNVVATWGVTANTKKFRFVMTTTLGDPAKKISGDPIEKFVWGTQFRAFFSAATNGTPCPTPAPTPTPTVDPEDGLHNATPMPNGPTPSGNPTPVTATPVPKP